MASPVVTFGGFNIPTPGGGQGMSAPAFVPPPQVQVGGSSPPTNLPPGSVHVGKNGFDFYDPFRLIKVAAGVGKSIAALVINRPPDALPSSGGSVFSGQVPTMTDLYVQMLNGQKQVRDYAWADAFADVVWQAADGFMHS